MPANLNALIRYKQIDNCLKNQYLHTTIEILQNKCSEQLGEHRGIYKLISERTIREDLRVMKSDALGFNAPIVVKDGIYSYSNKNYSIFNSSIDNIDLLKSILKLLVGEKNNIKNPTLENVINTLNSIINNSESEYSYFDYPTANHLEIENNHYKNVTLEKTMNENLYNWKFVLELI